MLHSSRMDMGIRTIVNVQLRTTCTSTTERLDCSLIACKYPFMRGQWSCRGTPHHSPLHYGNSF